MIRLGRAADARQQQVELLEVRARGDWSVGPGVVLGLGRELGVLSGRRWGVQGGRWLVVETKQGKGGAGGESEDETAGEAYKGGGAKLCETCQLSALSLWTQIRGRDDMTPWCTYVDIERL